MALAIGEHNMTQRWISVLGGATAAFLLISQQGFGQPVPGPDVTAADGSQDGGEDWMNGPLRSFNTTSLKIDDIVGTVNVAVRDQGPMTVQVVGARNRVNSVHVAQKGGRLDVQGSSEDENNDSVWDWHNWFNFSQENNSQSGRLIVNVTVAKGTSVDIEDLVGDATIGDTAGPLHFEAAASKARIGSVASANISLGGSGQIAISHVAGELALDMGGSGKFDAGSAGNVKADIAGSGEANFGAIANGLSVDIAGSGDVTAARVNGPTHIEIAGSGNIKIADGIANPFHLEIMGAGNCYFGGVAIDPHIEAVGSGSVRIKAYRGHLDNEGMADVKIGD